MSLAWLIPDAEVLLALAPEELAFYILAGGVTAVEQWADAHPNAPQELIGTAGREPAYPRARHNEIEVAITEAWRWLENQLLLVPEPGINGQMDFGDSEDSPPAFVQQINFGLWGGSLAPAHVLSFIPRL